MAFEGVIQNKKATFWDIAYTQPSRIAYYDYDNATLKCEPTADK